MTSNSVDAPLVLLINGPNLNLLGKREPEIYGFETLEEIERKCAEYAKKCGIKLESHQSNREYEIIDLIQDAREKAAGIIINPAAFSHTSIAILDALNAFSPPVIEVHLSNIYKREEFRHHSYISKRANSIIAGCGTQGYILAIERISYLIQGEKLPYC